MKNEMKNPTPLFLRPNIMVITPIAVLFLYGLFINLPTNSCSVNNVGFHMGSTIAIKFNDDGRFSYSDNLMNQPKSFWGTWEQQGEKIITTNDRSTTGSGIGQRNSYKYDCNKLTIGRFTLVKD